MANSDFPQWMPSHINAECSHAASILCERSDLLWWDSATATVKPASSIADAGTAAATQTLLATNFAGVAISRQLATDIVARNARILIDGIIEFPCVSATYALGVYVTANYNVSVLQNQVLVQTPTLSLAIGRVVKHYPVATTRVKVRLTSALLMGLVRIYNN